MKEKIVLFFVMMMFMLCVGAYAENLIYYQDSTATETLRMIPVSDITPLPINGVVNIGSATIEAGSPPTENIIVAVSVSAVATDVASIANRKSINFFNNDSAKTAWISLDSTTASATVQGACIPLPPYGFVGVELDSVKVAGLIASEAMTVYVYQDGY
jgi:hypothetical protein